MSAALAVGRTRSQERGGRGAAPTAALLAFLLVGLSGCPIVFRRGPCAEFTAAADACYAEAGLDPFFEANVDCEEPVSTVREYKCLIEQYGLADCSTAALAHDAVEAASQECLGWSEPLDDDDSAE